MTQFARRNIVIGSVAAPALIAPTRARAKEKEVGAVEDLMREHGVLRRVFMVYQESAPRLRRDPAKVDARALHEAAQLFRAFGEEYHEKKLEEAHIFAAVKKAGGPAAGYVDVLKQQHDRGRQITAYVLSATRSGKIAGADADPLARAFGAFQIMYANHTAREDTIVFPAWKDALSEHELAEMSEKFEDIEKATFGKDGFEDAVKSIGRIEEALGVSDIAQFTAPPPR